MSSFAFIDLSASSPVDSFLSSTLLFFKSAIDSFSFINLITSSFSCSNLAISSFSVVNLTRISLFSFINLSLPSSIACFLLSVLPLSKLTISSFSFVSLIISSFSFNNLIMSPFSFVNRTTISSFSFSNLSLFSSIVRCVSSTVTSFK
uniref:Uncharacterized protein n=1 Tax=Arundo donax TaxID=35708 RepID=A0A0A9EDL3_ARUDO